MLNKSMSIVQNDLKEFGVKLQAEEIVGATVKRYPNR